MPDAQSPAGPNWISENPERSMGQNPAENYERYFVPAIGLPHAIDLVARAEPGAGERILDVACGTGVVARLVERRVAPKKLVGLDVNPGMLSVARAADDDSSIEWHQASADAMPLADGSFDVVLCQLGLQFMPDKLAALREMRRVTAEGGRLALNVAGSAPEPFAIMEEEMGRHLGKEVGAFVHAVFSLDDAEQVTSLVEEAGFRDVAAHATAIDLRLPPPKEFLWQYVFSTPLAAAVSQSDRRKRDALEEAIVERWQPFVEDGGLSVRSCPIVATGHA